MLEKESMGLKQDTYVRKEIKGSWPSHSETEQDLSFFILFFLGGWGGGEEGWRGRNSRNYM